MMNLKGVQPPRTRSRFRKVNLSQLDATEAIGGQEQETYWPLVMWDEYWQTREHYTTKITFLNETFDFRLKVVFFVFLTFQEGFFSFKFYLFEGRLDGEILVMTYDKWINIHLRKTCLNPGYKSGISGSSDLFSFHRREASGKQHGFDTGKSKSSSSCSLISDKYELTY